VAQGIGPEFKPQYHKKEKNKKNQVEHQSWLLGRLVLGGSVVRGQPGQTVLEISKITRAKWTGGMAQAVECLLSKVQSPK
jgi:hypothetical protein